MTACSLDRSTPFRSTRLAPGLHLVALLALGGSTAACADEAPHPSEDAGELGSVGAGQTPATDGAAGTSAPALGGFADAAERARAAASAQATPLSSAAEASSSGATGGAPHAVLPQTEIEASALPMQTPALEPVTPIVPRPVVEQGVETDPLSEPVQTEMGEGIAEGEVSEPLEPVVEPTEAPEEVEPVASEFDIQLEFESDEFLSETVRAAFASAEARWESVIIGDVPDFQAPNTPSCDGNRVPDMVDDIVIYVSVAPIDGPEGILGAAGPCLVRAQGLPLPFAGRMEFDSEDLTTFADQGRLEEIVLHEMGHVLGVGSLWQAYELLRNPAGQGGGTPDTSFLGERALTEFEALGGDEYADGDKVPVENSGGAGVANGHWRESVLGNELMTPFMSQLDGVLSRITIASLEDLGYEVSYAAAGDYAWPPPDEPGRFPFGPQSVELPPIDLSNDMLTTPIYAVDSDGRAVLLR